MNELSLFSGGGGGLLATKHLLGWRTVGYVEWEKYCQEIIKARIRDGLLDDAPIWGDISAFNGKQYRGLVDVVTAGFPCQGFSAAGKRLGEKDERNMWPDTIRIIREVGPRFALLENSPNLLSFRYFGTILGELHEAGFNAEWEVIGANEVGAPHERKRLWILAHSRHGSRRNKRIIETRNQEARKWTDDTNTLSRSSIQSKSTPKWWDKDPAEIYNSNGNNGRKKQEILIRSRQGSESGRGRENRKREIGTTQPFVGRVAHGVAHRVDKHKALGNGQVPRVAFEAWNRLTSDIVEE